MQWSQQEGDPGRVTVCLCGLRVFAARMREVLGLPLLPHISLAHCSLAAGTRYTAVT